MFSAIWNAAAMIAGARDSWNSVNSSESAVRKIPRPSSMYDWHEPEWQGDAGFSEDPDNRGLQWGGTGTGTGNNKLFLQLLDDLDGLTTNTDSAHRRRKARELMSDYIFRPDLQVHGDQIHRGHPLRRSSAAEYGLRPPELLAARNEWTSRRSSGDFSGIQVPSPKVSPEHRAARCRSGDFSNVELLISPKPSPQHSGRSQRGHLDRIQWQSHPPFGSTKENEDDSGYHTGSQHLSSKRSPGPRTLSREDCRRRISLFNRNNHGLVMDPPQEDCDTFQGSIRVHMNLIRPINMCISIPPTVDDSHRENNASDTSPSHSVQMTSFYLPKETSKVIHINSSMRTQEVIQVLLSKFHITDNPRKFALYEKAYGGSKAATMRRIRDDEVPLQICLAWTDEGVDNLDMNQFVLQDYDTGEILWEAFSLPELESFLAVLNREETEYIEQVKTKFRLLKVQMMKKLQEHENNPDAACGPKRKPVFV